MHLYLNSEAAGIVEGVAGGAGELLGIGLDGTGIGAIAGVGLNIAGVAAIGHASSVMYNGASNLGKDASDLVQSFKGGSSEGTGKVPEEAREVDIQLKYKEGWTDAQKAEADAKVKALSEADTVKTAPERSSTSASSRYKKANGEDSVPAGKDVDHTVDLQLGGAEDVLNMNPLDQSVNRSLGKQIQNKIKDYPNGTEFGNFTISDGD